MQLYGCMVKGNVAESDSPKWYWCYRSVCCLSVCASCTPNGQSFWWRALCSNGRTYRHDF